MAQQISFFREEQRILLATDDASITYEPGTLSADESCGYFARLREELPWQQTEMWMYDRMVAVPRLTAWYGADAELPPPLMELRALGERHLGAEFNSAGVNLYRSGNDSVAWHSDRNEGLIEGGIVAILSLGATREMLLRTRREPRTTARCDLEPGSLLVMRGNAQERFEHAVPKVRTPCGERISVVFRQKATPF